MKNHLAGINLLIIVMLFGLSSVLAPVRAYSHSVSANRCGRQLRPLLCGPFRRHALGYCATVRRFNHQPGANQRTEPQLGDLSRPAVSGARYIKLFVRQHQFKLTEHNRLSSGLHCPFR